MENINYEKIITSDEFINNIEDLNIISTILSIELKKLNLENYAKGNIHLRAREISSTGLYINYTAAEREYIAVNIMYDDEDFINFLLDLNITFKNLEKICKTIEVFKLLKQKNPNDSFFISKYHESLVSLIKKLCLMAQKKFETQDDYLTINKLMYVLTFKKELYVKLQKQKAKKLQ